MSQEDAGQAAAKRTRKLILYVLIAVAALEAAFALAAWLLAHR